MKAFGRNLRTSKSKKYYWKLLDSMTSLTEGVSTRSAERRITIIADDAIWAPLSIRCCEAICVCHSSTQNLFLLKFVARIGDPPLIFCLQWNKDPCSLQLGYFHSWVYLVDGGFAFVIVNGRCHSCSLCGFHLCLCFVLLRLCLWLWFWLYYRSMDYKKFRLGMSKSHLQLRMVVIFRIIVI